MKKLKTEDWIKIHKVLYSCQTQEQLDIAFNWCLRFIHKLWGEVNTFYMQGQRYNDIKLMTNEVKNIRKVKGWK